MRLKYFPVGKLIKSQKKAIFKLRKECFSDLDPEELKKHFIAKRFGRIFVHQNKKIIAGTGLFKRYVNFDGKRILLGGLGGVCVLKKYRRRGIATKLVRYGLNILQKKGCDVATLSVDLEKQIYGLYKKNGFKFINRKVSFNDINHKKHYIDGVMFLPLHSQEKYDHIMNSKKNLHMGKGYW